MKPFPGAHDLLARVHAAGQTVVLASSASSKDQLLPPLRDDLQPAIERHLHTEQVA